MQVHWLRVLLDEGHLLGASLGLTAKLRMACALHAERRWVMTGTPTPSGRSTTSMEHLQPLLAFLRQVHSSTLGPRCLTGTTVTSWPEALRSSTYERQETPRACEMQLDRGLIRQEHGQPGAPAALPGLPVSGQAQSTCLNF